MPNQKLTGMKTLAALADQVERFGDRPAVIRFTREGQENWSCSRMAKEAKRLATGLREEGVEAGEPVAIIAEPSPEWFVAALAILRIGAVLAPIDTQMSDDDLERAFDDSGASRVFGTERVARRLSEIKVQRELTIFRLDESDEEAEGAEVKQPHWRTLLRDEPAPPASVKEEDRAVLFYTSGTTGPPKGVPLSHRNIVFQIRAVEKTGMVREDDRMLLPLPLHHVYPLVIGLFTPFGLGVTLLLPHALTGDALVRALSEGNGSVILGVPRLYRALFEGIRAKVGGAGSLANGLFSAALGLARVSRRIGIPVGNLLFKPIRKKMGPRIRMLASGGSPLDPELAENLEALGWPIAVGYGLTETSPLLTLKRPGEASYASVGRPIEGVELKIDSSALPEGGREAQEAGKTWHERGEVLARGPNVFSGYHNLPEKTRKAFKDGWFRTGDLGYLDQDGFLYLSGRASSMIVLEGGENINPEDLEGFYSAAEEVAEVGVLEEKGKLVALAVPDRSVLREHKGEEVAKVVKKALEKRASELASYRRLSNIEVSREPLPTTRLGKIKRHLLAERYEAAKKGEEGGKREKGPVPIEQLESNDRALLENSQAKKLWKLLAKRYADRRLTPDASLELDLGIDSLEWVELSISAQERAGVSITEDLIEKAETVRDLLEGAASGRAEELAEGRQPIEKPEEVLKDSDKRWATPVGAGMGVITSVVYGILRALMGLKGCRVEVHGLEKLPENGSYILAPNHVSYLDAPSLTVALGHGRFKRYFWAGHGEVMFRNVLRRWVSRLFQVVPIDPRRGPLTSLAVGALVVKRGHPLVWFPEGQVSKDGKLQNFQPGIGLIAAHYEPTVIPVFIAGTYELMPLGTKIPLSGRIDIHFGTPIDGKTLKEEAELLEEGERHQRITRVLQEKVKKLAESLSEELQRSGKDSRKAA